MKKFFKLLFLAVLLYFSYLAYQFYVHFVYEKEILKKVVERLNADSRVAEVLVTDVKYDEATAQVLTTIKLLEYDSRGEPLLARYFSFFGNIIQFQSLVVRFDDIFIEKADTLKGKSAYLFLKAFMLDGANTQEYEITKAHEVPAGYRISSEESNPIEEEFWSRFWDYALNSEEAKTKGIKNAQIEAPGTKFVPGVLYTLKIEHDGGLRIDTQQLPGILKGEKVPL